MKENKKLWFRNERTVNENTIEAWNNYKAIRNIYKVKI